MALQLGKKGIGTVWPLTGGFDAWRARALPVAPWRAVGVATAPRSDVASG